MRLFLASTGVENAANFVLRATRASHRALEGTPPYIAPPRILIEICAVIDTAASHAGDDGIRPRLCAAEIFRNRRAASTRERAEKAFTVTAAISAAVVPMPCRRENLVMPGISRHRTWPFV